MLPNELHGPMHCKKGVNKCIQLTRVYILM